jgi:tRNA A-37 threonylcarbamoyl transferase component Bud32
MAGDPLPPADIPALDARLEQGRLGRYEILGRLAEGGMGAVFKARHSELGKIVALKMLPAGRMDEVGVARFKNEIRAIGRLDHPNIVAAHDAGELHGVHFLVMDFVEGMDLARVLEYHGHLSIADACEAVRQAALGLQHALERGLVHRDIKPSNLMLARSGCVQVVDLGLARSFADATADTLTAKGMLLGTADYLAPEQWEHAHAADTRGDIYSLGCTLYHLIAGRPPFAGATCQSLLQKMRAHLNVPPPPVEQFCPQVPAALTAVLDRMLAKDPTARFQSPAEVAKALHSFTLGSDLSSLLGKEEPAAGVGVPIADTPAPGLWETTSERIGNRPHPPRRPRSHAFYGALAGLCLVIAIPLLLLLASGGLSRQAVKPLGIIGMHITHFRNKGTTLRGDLRTSPEAVRVNDDVRVTGELSAPAHCYLIAFNPDGTEQLCYPEDADGMGAQATRPDARTEIHYPQDRHVFVLDAVGLQAFVLAASTQPLPPYEDWRSGTGTMPWKTVQTGGAWRWYFDGRQFTRYPQERGRIEPKETAPEALQKLCDFFKSRSEFEVVQLFAFPVVGAP